MTIDEAKAVLCVWRPDGRDHADPAFHEALEVARRNPQLLHWLHAQQDFDAAMTDHLRAVHAPVEGRAEILAHGRLVLKQRSLRRRARVLALAAIVVAAAVGWWRLSTLMEPVLPSRPFTLAGAAEHLSVHHKSMEFYADDPAALQAWLAGRKNPVPTRLPGQLSSLRGYGTQDWRTTRGRISLICFYPEAGRQSGAYGDKTEWLHFFTFPKGLAKLPDATATPQIVEGNEWIFVVWRDGDQAFALGLPAKPGAKERLWTLAGA